MLQTSSPRGSDSAALMPEPGRGAVALSYARLGPRDAMRRPESHETLADGDAIVGARSQPRMRIDRAQEDRAITGVSGRPAPRSPFFVFAHPLHDLSGSREPSAWQ